MNPTSEQLTRRKTPAFTRKVNVYAPLFLLICIATGGSLFWAVLTFLLMLKTPPVWGWVVPLASAGLFYLCYLVLRKYVRLFRKARGFRPLGPTAPWVALTWVVFAAFRFFFLVSYMRAFDLQGRPPGEMDMYARLPYGQIAVLLFSCAFAPLVKELTFRGLIQRAFEHRCTPAVAITAAAAVFAVPHFDGAMVLTHFFGGLMYGYAVYVTRSVWAGVILHAGHNATDTALGQWVGDNWLLVAGSGLWLTTSACILSLLLLILLGRKLWRMRKPLRRLGPRVAVNNFPPPSR
jgi:membrane protease YdiL (CAAX protease family)